MEFTEEEKQLLLAKRREYHRNYAKTHRDRVNQYQRNWNKRNPDKLRAYANAYWLRKAEQGKQSES